MAHSNGDYLRRLLHKAILFCLEDGLETESVTVLFRNKSEAYFDDIDRNHGGMMRTYMKDMGGDPKCPLNGQLKGLFFGVNLFQGGLPTKSPFGRVRICMDLSEVFNYGTNLYFADFYCKIDSTPHYITLVVSKTGTKADDFCKKHLIPLDLSGNIFLRKQYGNFQALRKFGLILEIFYTEDVNVSNKVRDSTGTIGRGHSNPVVGIPKDPSCSECNISLF